VSGGYLSYQTYPAKVVIDKFHDLLAEEWDQALKDAITDGEVVPREMVDTLYDAIAHGDDVIHPVAAHPYRRFSLGRGDFCATICRDHGRSRGTLPLPCSVPAM
jgi:hypothetical protein